MNIIGFCDTDTAIGLRLAGIKDVRIPNLDLSDLMNLWNAVEEESDTIGLIFITENLAEHLGQQLKEYRLRNTIPIVIEIPDKKGRKKDHIDYVSYLMKKAVGMDIKK
jgi:V/A-type H+/Na+-transporting ATPase subunit F